MEFNLLSVGAEKSKETRKWFWGIEVGRFQKNEESHSVPLFCIIWDGTALLLDVLVWEFVLFEKK